MHAIRLVSSPQWGEGHKTTGKVGVGGPWLRRGGRAKVVAGRAAWWEESVGGGCNTLGWQGWEEGEGPRTMGSEGPDVCRGVLLDFL